eukprot:1607738-Prymnesium_polylepis.2
MERSGIARANRVTIDVEGFDVLVLEGMKRALRARSVDVVKFEYSNQGYWSPHHVDARTLRSTLAWLNDDFGYKCYSQSQRWLVPASPPCWKLQFETHSWSNLICAAAPPVLKVLQEHASSGCDTTCARH